MVMKMSTKISRFLVNVQLAFFALLQIAQIREFIQEHHTLQRVLYTIGILFNYDTAGLQVSAYLV